MRNGRIKYRTKDTSLSQNMADKSEISLDQLETHEERHNLYCYLGQSGHFSPVISAKRKMDDGDILCLYKEASGKVQEMRSCLTQRMVYQNRNRYALISKTLYSANSREYWRIIRLLQYL